MTFLPLLLEDECATLGTNVIRVLYTLLWLTSIFKPKTITEAISKLCEVTGGKK